MNSSAVSRRVGSRRALVAVLVLAAAVITGIVVPQIVQQMPPGAAAATRSGGLAPEVSKADGLIADGAQLSVFDDSSPAVANLSVELLSAVRDAATAARAGGVEFTVNSGWRSRALQAKLLDDAVATYGTKEEAARWVATPDTSSHVTGDAVDLGPWPALDWLSQRGASYGLCQTYSNEPWHYELRPEAVDAGCPQPFADPTEDPRMK